MAGLEAMKPSLMGSYETKLETKLEIRRQVIY
jgi:hypothetical protein